MVDEQYKLILLRKKKAYVCSHKRVWSNCQQAEIEKQQCGYDGITESVCFVDPLFKSDELHILSAMQ